MTARMATGLIRALALAVAFTAASITPAAADLAGRELVEALRAGGHILYFRHAETDWSQGDNVERAGDWTSCDPDRMRQITAEGRATARRIGAAIRRLGIPVAKVLSSEYCRVVETAREMALGQVETTRAIMNMRAAAFVGGREAVAQRARRVLSTPPAPGSNTLVVGHGNVMRAATGDYTGEGGSGIYRPAPDGEPGFVPVAKLAPQDWEQLAEEFAAPR